MNTNDLLHKIIDLLPALVGALKTHSVVLNAGLNALAAGKAQLIQAVANTGIGKAASAALGGVASMGGASLAALGAALATPLGQAALAAVAAGAALVALGVITEKLGRTFLESQRHLANSSASMAAVFAQSDFRRLLRENRAGEQQAGTADSLAKSLDKLASTMQPITTLLMNIGNTTFANLADLVNLIVGPLATLAELANKGVEKLEELIKGKDREKTFLVSEWLNNVMEEDWRRRMVNDPRTKTTVYPRN